MDTAKRARKGMVRSPNYPAFSLSEALQRAQVIYENERRAYTVPDVIQKHWGYKPGTGPGRRALSALRQYGLLEEKSGTYRLSDIAMTLLHAPEGSNERRSALEEAARKPAVFAEILGAYPDGLPSDDTLRSYLITKRGFNPAYVANFIATFRETVQLAKLLPGEYNQGERVETREETGMPSESEEQPQWSERKGGPSVQVFNWALSIPRNVRAELRLFGRDLRREDVEHLRKHLDLLEEAFQDDQKEPSDG